MVQNLSIRNRRCARNVSGVEEDVKNDEESGEVRCSGNKTTVCNTIQTQISHGTFHVAAFIIRLP
jgi:hypothetical protein